LSNVIWVFRLGGENAGCVERRARHSRNGGS
jgi:hypothetical protein